MRLGRLMLRNVRDASGITEPLGNERRSQRRKIEKSESSRLSTMLRMMHVTMGK
jgi:hypothetical protein